MFTIEVNKIIKKYGTQIALNEVSFGISKGEIVGLLGPNGAGKSTLMKILTSFLPPNEGTAKINGLDVQEQANEIKKLVGYLPENNPLYLDMYVKEYLEFILSIFSYEGNKAGAIKEVINLTKLGEEQHKKIGQLSKGYRQRVGLAQALIHQPQILILDEPTSGLDPNQLADIRQIISDLGKEKTIILSTHIMQEVEAMCGRTIIIDHGHVVADQSTDLLSDLVGSGQQLQVEFKEKVPQQMLESIPYIIKVENTSGNTWLIETKENKDVREDVFRFAVEHKFNVLSLAQKEQNIEDIFRRLTL